MSEKDLKGGENLMSLNDLHNTDKDHQRSQVYRGDKQIVEKRNGIWVPVGKDYARAGNTGDMRRGSINNKGFDLIHETFHFLGLSDRYDQKTMEPLTDFENDVMAGTGATTSQVHFNNWKNYLT